MAHPPVGARGQAGQAHGQVDQKEREHRHQTQGKQVKRALTLDARINARQALTKAALHPVAQQKAAAEHGQRGAQRRSERHQNKAFEQTEQRTGQQRHQRRTGQGQRRDGDIGEEEHPGSQPGLGADLRIQRGLLRLERFQVEVLANVEDKEAAQQGEDHAHQGQFTAIHQSAPPERTGCGTG